MERIFLDILNRSIAAGWMILAVIALRLLLRRAPKWIHCVLWGMVAVRLACPFSLESIFSLIPSKETVRHTTDVTTGNLIDSGVRFVDNVVNPVIREAAVPTPAVSVDPLQIWLFAGSAVWATGAGILLLYAAVGYIRLRLRVRTAVRLEGRVMVSEFVDTPFIFGVFRPRIYLPFGMSEELRSPVVAHELAHLRRRDNLWKVAGYILLAVYWFHPLCWAAYLLFCRDIELACDESVIKKYDMHQKKAYSEALLACSQGRRAALVCPLAFGEVGVKERIRSVLRYKKPAFWVMAVAAVACVVAAVCFMTDPVESTEGSGEAASAGAANGVSGSRLENDEEDSGAADGSGPEEAGDGSGEETGSGVGQDAEEEDAQAALRETLVGEWTEAFVNRDGNAVEAMITEELAAEMLEGPAGERSFGFSSPWPRDAEQDVYILNIGENSADIQYYAWTSEPHVTAWRERLFYELREGKYVVTDEELFWLDDISTGEVFSMAYGDCPIDGSPMDYELNGAGDALNDNALLDASLLYRGLFEPESAAVELLNLSDDPSRVKIDRLYEESGSVNLEITFMEEDSLPFRITMVQPYTDFGIWIPKSYRVDPMDRFMKMDWEEIRGRNLHVSRGGLDRVEDIVCIAEIPEADIKIYGYGDAECYGEGVAIEIGNVVNYFDWYYTSSHALFPECYWDEEDRQLQVALNIYTGTGVSAQELHVLQYQDTGTLTDHVLDINAYWQLLLGRIYYVFEEETGRLTFYDAVRQRELTSAEVGEDKVESMELGNISYFLLGDTIRLVLEPGYFPEGSAIAEYPEELSALEAELILSENRGAITFKLGEIRAVE